MAKYTEVFRLHAVRLLNALNEQGVVVVNSVEIKNVRQLVQELDVSSYSLYEWAKIYNPKESDDFDVNDLEEIEIDDFDLFGPERIDKSTGEKYKMDIKKIKGGAIKGFATNLRNLGALAQALQIPNYSRMILAQLKLSVGNELIKQSGLVDMKQASKKLKKNGDNL